MSLYKDASLVMIPSAYKDGKLYSIRPTDGDGDFTFSRGSNLAATRVDVNGLIEKGRENLFLYSEDVSNSAYAKIGVNATYNQIANPVNGNVTADKLETNGDANSEHMVRVTNYINAGVRTLSVYVKYINHQYVYLRELANNKYAVYDIQNGVVTREDAASSQITTDIQSVGNGWYRLSMTFLVTSIANNLIDVGLSPTDTSFAGAMSAGSEAYFYGFQLEAGLVATDYIETGASTAQAGILEDMPRLDYSGDASCPALLLEPQRTNSLTHSEHLTGYTIQNLSVDYNNIISPEGLKNAVKLTDNSTSGFHRLINSITTTAQDYTFSVYLKKGTMTDAYMQVLGGGNVARATIDLDAGTISATTGSATIEDAGDDWYRCIVTGTANAGTTYCYLHLNGTSTYVGSGDHLYVYGFQLEAGSYPTSYIPTYGASVTRSKDTGSLNLVGAGVNDGWTSGTILIEFEKPYNNENADAIRIHGDSVSGRAYIYNNGYGFASDWSYSSNFTIGENTKIIYRLNTLSTANLFKNGVKLTGAEGSGTAWSDIKYIYLNNQGGAKINIKQIVVFPTALTDSECIALTE